MDKKTLSWLKRKSKDLLPENLGTVLEIGSLNVNGSAREVLEDISNYYYGIDTRDGEGVDEVADGNNVDEMFREDGIDVVVYMNTLEHDMYFWETLESIDFVLKEGGYFIFSVPTYGFPLHEHPEDYWRLSESAIRDVVMDGYEILDLTTIYTKKNKGQKINPVINVIARKR